MRVTLFSRDEGCIGLKLDADDSTLVAFAKEISSVSAGETIWVWASERNLELPPGSNSFSPKVRPPTILSRETCELLVSDFKERDVDGEGRSLTLFGFERGIVAAGGLPDELGRRLQRFDQGEESGIQFVLSLFVDSGPFVFVPSKPSPVAAAALQALKVDDSSATEERPYKKMRRLRLGCQIEGIVDWLEGLK